MAESLRVAAMPRRPAWRESDPRWRRRVLAGAWILVLMPLMDVFRVNEWSSRLPVPAVLDLPGAVRTLDDALIISPSVYRPLVFCVGVVLLFSSERGRRRGKLDWTRRWGVLCVYVVMLLNAAEVFFIAAVVFAGIAAVFQSMPPLYQPAATQLIVDASAGYLLYGAHPMYAAGVACVAFSSITMLLACVPLFDALRSSGPKLLAGVLLAPLGLFSLMHLRQVGRYCLEPSPPMMLDDLFLYDVYFRPELLVNDNDDLAAGMVGFGPSVTDVRVEAAKWCIVLGIAVWLSIAHIATWRQRKTAIAA